MSSSRMPAWVVGAQATGALAAVGSVGSLTGLTPVWGAGAACVVAACLLLVEVARPGGAVPGRVIIQMVRAAGLGAWLVWCLWPDTEPLRVAPLGTLAAGCMVGAHLSLLQPTKRTPGTGIVLRSTSEWRQRVERVGGPQFRGVEITRTIPWDNGCGYDLHVTLPPGGVTRRDLERHADALAADADLPEGCGVQVLAQGSRRNVVLRIATTNRLAQTIDRPAASGGSMTGVLVFGEYSNSEPVAACLRENSMLATGQRGSGKTTLLQVTTAACASTVDGLVWHLDLNGGGISQPWVDVWLDGRVKRCPIDWPAPTMDEAIRALKAGIAIAKHRKTAYRKRKRAANASLLPIGPDLPQITVIVDEGAEAVKNAKLESLLAELQNIGRDAAVNVVLSALRPTGDLIPPNMRKQTGVRVAMHSPDEEEYAYMFGWGKGGDLTNDLLAGRGTGFISVEGASASPFRGYNLTPAAIESLAVEVAQARPDLDEASAAAAGEGYATRWDRARTLFADDGAAMAEPEREPAPASSASGAGAWPDPADIGRTHAARPALPAGHAPGRVNHTSSSTTHRDLLEDVIAVFDEHGVDLMPRRILAEKLTDGDEDRLRFLLKGHGVVPYHQSFRWSGKTLRGYHRVDVEAARAP